MGGMPVPDHAEVLAAVAPALAEDGRLALCQIVRAEGSTPGKPGWKMLVRAGGGCVGNLGGGALEAMIRTDAVEKLGASRPRSEVKRYYLTEEAVRGEATGMVCGGFVDVFVEVLEERPVLAICGGGPVGQALALAGELAGFDLLVADDRPEFRRVELFPEGTALATVDRKFSQPFLAQVATRELHLAVVSRCWETDTEALASVVAQNPPRLAYLGLMGSQRKVARVREELGNRGVELNGHDLRAPIGLPLGGDSPGEIAVSILAEILHYRHRIDVSNRDVGAPDRHGKED